MQNPVQMKLTRRQTLAGLGAGISTLALAGCTGRMGLASTPQAQSASALLDEIAWNLIELEPGTATGLGIDTGDKAYLRSRMSDLSPEGMVHYAGNLRDGLAKVRAFDKAGLDAATLTSLEVVESAYATALEGFALPYGDVATGSWRNAPYAVIQNVGAYLDVPRFLDSDHPVRTKEDAEAYVARLDAYPAMLDGELERMQAATRLGVIPPAFLLDKAIAQMENSLADARADGGLVTSLTGRTKDIPGDWANAAGRIVSAKVRPALERQLAELRNQRTRATDDAGMWARPDGEEWYRWALKASTTTGLGPDEIHEMGLSQLAEIHGRMDAILRDIGYKDGPVGQRMRELAEDPRFKFAEGDPGRAQIMEFIQQRIDWIREQMPRAFRTQVRANLEVRRLPLSEEPGAPTAYGGSGSIDGTIPGKMWINLMTTDLHREYTLPTLVHHETIPGHVWQGEYANQMPLIRSRLAFNAYSEGWALYAEQLADELGAYADHPAWRLGYLQDQAFRACRLVVDTGLHHKRWTREQGVAFFVERNGDNPQEVASEVDRYCSWPGQACGYKVGHTEIVRQRSLAQAALGSGFDLRDFDDAVVKGGNVPLDVLAKNVARYVEGARS
ncbi:DUF885 domain-containing protein [Altererythrobacter sp. CC-YST694]|uniref:DUF885 domain-containing protein n=1 Tax=Altererythrobacter sp. CC-YST694 TaxID=2755038 RepID=UPI001D030AA1|nr:DUF885 domain-containing protein [Altererythrobacter sp. CC-YST694]MCB5424874.1 DUF885 domain-containing protein [Altererythrobacter sp. CC-YST694]